jgi:hypothetical protein
MIADLARGQPACAHEASLFGVLSCAVVMIGFGVALQVTQ